MLNARKTTKKQEDQKATGTRDRINRGVIDAAVADARLFARGRYFGVATSSDENYAEPGNASRHDLELAIKQQQLHGGNFRL